MDYVWDAFYAVGVTNSPSLASVPIFPQHCQRDLYQHYEVDPEIIGRGSFAFVRRVKLLRNSNNGEESNNTVPGNNGSTKPPSNDAIYNRWYACKTISKSNSYDRELFLREVYNLNRCQTKTPMTTDGSKDTENSRNINSNYNVIRLLDVIEDRSSVHIVTELCKGGELFEYVAKEHERTGLGLRGKALSPSTSYGDSINDGDETRCATIIHQILTAFRFLHEDASVCHRDAKASNFVFVQKPSFVSGSLELRVIDFGLSKFVGKFQEENAHRNTIEVDNDEIKMLDGAKTPLESTKRELDTSTSRFHQAFGIWDSMKASYFSEKRSDYDGSATDANEVTAKMLESEGDIFDSRGFSLNDRQYDGRHQSNSKLNSELDSPTLPSTNNITKSIDDNNQIYDETLYSKHYPRMTSEVGTPYYVAPEVLKQQKQQHHISATSASTSTTTNDDTDHSNGEVGYSTKCDIWSVGVLCFLTLTGTLPIIGEDEQETVQMLMDPVLEVDFSDETLWEQHGEVIDAKNLNDDSNSRDELQQFQKENRTTGSQKPKISNSALRFCKALLQRDPENRPTAREALRFDWIVKHCGESVSPPPSPSPSFATFTVRGAPHHPHPPRLPSLSASFRD